MVSLIERNEAAFCLLVKANMDTQQEAAAVRPAAQTKSVQSFCCGLGEMDVGGVCSSFIKPKKKNTQTFHTSDNPFLRGEPFLFFFSKSISSVSVGYPLPLPLLFKRSAPTSDPAGDGGGGEESAVPLRRPAARRPGHRRLRARATVRTTPRSIRKGSHVFRKPPQLTCFPWTRTRRQSFTMFHEALFS